MYEVELGVTLGELIELAGGMRDGSELQAVLLGGAAGGFAGPADLDLPLTFEATRAAGLTLGSGVVMVLDQHVDLVDQLAAHRRVLPRRVVRPVRALPRRHRAPGGGARSGWPSGAGRRRRPRAARATSAQAMRDASICGLGQTAANAIESAIVRLGVFR